MIRITKISIGAPGRERLVLLHAWPDGDFLENTCDSQRVKELKETTDTALTDLLDNKHLASLLLSI